MNIAPKQETQDSHSGSVVQGQNELSKEYEKMFGIRNAIYLDENRLPVFMQEYLSLCSRFTDADKGALITALLPIIAVNIGNRICLLFRGRVKKCRLWAVLAGKSTISRKSTAIGLALRTLQPFIKRLEEDKDNDNLNEMPILSSVTMARLTNLLSKNSNRVLVYNEFASLMHNGKQQYNQGMQSILMDVYDGQSQCFTTMERNDYVRNPALSLLAGSTEGNVYSFFQNQAERDSGFTQRFIYCMISSEDKEFKGEWDDEEEDYSELEKLDEIYEIFRSISSPQMLKFSHEAKNLWNEKYTEIMNGICPEDEDLTSYSERILSDSFFSIATIISLMKDHQELKAALEANAIESFFETYEVSEESAAEAMYLCEYYLQNAKPLVQILQAGGNFVNEKRIFDYLSRQPEHSATRSDIMRKLSLTAKAAGESMTNLLMLEYISSEIVAGSGNKPKTIYTLIDRRTAI